ncbi:CcdB family protein [Azospirillum sp. TSO35-2]|uniref:CcdB family protein n=1 Tax=Azospirillum sp. TSO35-2 TaxID=716796 RepID=UPI000D61F8B8|nr:CcdB family protein [Azospirillum sp. TSO35-2]PWC39540.1 plasmid maintenance protein CcdB [Azospirillum sp. TSO35-2]
MAQFDVHRNRGATRSGTPYLVVVQSQRFDASKRRVVVPLLAADAVQTAEPSLTPTFVVERRDVLLNPLQLASVPAEQLGERVCSLADDSDRIVAAIDLLISRAWG